MRLSIDTKEVLFLLFMLFVFFPIFNIAMYFCGILPLYSLMKNDTEIFYDWKMVILLFTFIFFTFLHCNAFLLIFVEKIPLIKNTIFIKKITELTLKLCMIFLLIAFGIAPFISFFISGYVNSHYHPCSDNTGIFSAATYVKNGTLCHRR
ncbi:hypothetical protein FTS83_21710 [Salmonella enterica subsp. salamae]|nr:hypothetical protein [Salmonella enterica subsp. salamae serovar Sofia]ECD9453215.1 hypothetical protein [Salmonella enterica subsp. salamae serovar Sofia]ECL7269577.1 hypothetical protein [Salmonella enterica subsp. salamae]